MRKGRSVVGMKPGQLSRAKRGRLRFALLWMKKTRQKDPPFAEGAKYAAPGRRALRTGVGGYMLRGDLVQRVWKRRWEGE